jgi:hypothetical protein
MKMALWSILCRLSIGQKEIMTHQADIIELKK